MTDAKKLVGFFKGSCNGVGRAMEPAVNDRMTGVQNYTQAMG